MASTQPRTQAARGTGADSDSGSMGDLHAAACRAELWRMADARGAARAVRAPGEDTPRAVAREPVKAVGRSVACDWALRAGGEQVADRALCKAVEWRAGRLSNQDERGPAVRHDREHCGGRLVHISQALAGQWMRVVSPSTAQGVPNGSEGIPGTLRRFRALYGLLVREKMF